MARYLDVEAREDDVSDVEDEEDEEDEGMSRPLVALLD